MRTMRGVAKIALAALCAWLIGAWLLTALRDEWSGFVYPNKDDLSRHLEIGPYPTIDACRSASLRALSTTFTPPGDYECGLNCREDPQHGGIKVCKVTER